MRLRWQRTSVALAMIAAVGLSACSNRLSDSDNDAAQGVSKDSIKIGSSLPQSGPLAVFRLYGVGANAYFKYLNAEKGGIDGRKVDFTVYDDGGTPSRTVENVRRLIGQDKVFALAFVFGSANNLAIRDLANEAKVPQLYVNSGLPDFGSPEGIDEYPYTIGWLPPYNLEAAAHAQYLKKTRPNAKVAILYQNDDLGSSLVKGFKKSSEGTGIKIVGEQSYNLSDPTVSSQMAVLARSDADVFLNYSQSTFTTQAIKTKTQLGWNAQMILPTFGASPAILKPAGLQNSKGAVSGVFLKDPTDPQWAEDQDVAEYRRIIKKYGGAAADPNSLQIAFGFAQGQLLAKALDQMAEPTPEAAMKAVRSMKGVELSMLYPGITVTTSETDGYPLESIAIQRFTGSAWRTTGQTFDLEGRAQELG